MARRAAGRFVAWFRPDRGTGGGGLQAQLYGAIRQAVLAGELAPGERLPSSRSLAADLGLGRNTVVTACDRLVAEGYLEARPGAGLFVAADLPPEGIPGTMPPRPAGASRRPATPPVKREQAVAPLPLTPGMPALDEVPLELWRRLTGQVLRRQGRGLLGSGDPAGLPALRAALAGYLAATRGVACEPGRIVIVSGAQQALDLAGRLLLRPGDAVALEDPGYPGAHAVFGGLGARLLPLPVDGQGLDPAALASLDPAPRLTLLTPSHQFPLGMTLPLARRLALLQLAATRDIYLIEDDYDCEYRYAGPPLQALQGLGAGDRVIYAGTFSKVLFPGLRLGYVVLPPDLVGGFLALKRAADGFAPQMSQAVLAAFITEGHLAQHVRRMRMLYRRRRAALLDALGREDGGLLRLRPSEAGLHVVADFADRRDDRAAAAAAQAAGLGVMPLSRYALATPSSGLLVGFAGDPEERIAGAVQRLLAVLR
ncbi:PLP-dependent aminotransferase family protein [Ferrovibrio sp.]|uniref:MocR-like pyridoxine biosynthesis transcription factor PdxR n=1 Tax=Ferrovibrio sp. TaxID=1917215 RepID=UPI003513BAB1